MNTARHGSIFPPPEIIAFAGDWHANTAWAVRAVFRARDLGAQVIIHTGDFGYDYLSMFISVLEEALAKAGILILFVRGNHDDPEFLDNLPDNDEGFKPVSDHIWYIPQGKAWTWDGIKFLGLGGAHSIDRKIRVERDLTYGTTSWWPGETISTLDAFRAVHQGQADVMITHDCPAGVSIPGLGGPDRWDVADLARSHRHRERLREVVEKVEPSLLVHGHYHARYTAYLNLPGKIGTRVVGLDCDATTMDLNLAFFRMEDFKNGVFNAVS